MTDLSVLLRQHEACPEARDWAKPYATLAEAWAVCPRGDWMLQLAATAKLCSHERLVLAACGCARVALPHVPPGEQRPLIAIETAERWARGEATLEEVVDASQDAYAASLTGNLAAGAATLAALNAAHAVDAAKAASKAAANAGFAAVYAARPDARAAARDAALRRCADIARQIIPVNTEEEVKT